MFPVKPKPPPQKKIAQSFAVKKQEIANRSAAKRKEEEDDEWAYGSEHEEESMSASDSEKEDEKPNQMTEAEAQYQAFLMCFLAPYDMRDTFLLQRKYNLFMEVA